MLRKPDQHYISDSPHCAEYLDVQLDQPCVAVGWLGALKYHQHSSLANWLYVSSATLIIHGQSMEITSSRNVADERYLYLIYHTLPYVNDWSTDVLGLVEPNIQMCFCYLNASRHTKLSRIICLTCYKIIVLKFIVANFKELYQNLDLQQSPNTSRPK